MEIADLAPKVQWFDRRFRFDLPASWLPFVLERLRGTPARLEERLRDVPDARVRQRPPDGSWSILENAGHLLDLESLWLDRLDDFRRGADALRGADLSNRRTHDANHNRPPACEILEAFRDARETLVRRFEGLDETLLDRTCSHPRLEVPMRPIDHAFFVAEHDDHHLARISQIVRLL